MSNAGLESTLIYVPCSQGNRLKHKLKTPKFKYPTPTIYFQRIYIEQVSSYKNKVDIMKDGNIIFYKSLTALTLVKINLKD